LQCECGKFRDKVREDLMNKGIAQQEVM